MQNSIQIKNLTKKFGDFTAVDNISFEIKKGEIFGFLGPNGAGKTTTIRMLCGILDPTSGEGKVNGFDISKQSEEIKKTIGYMSQKFSLYEDLTVLENIDFYAGIYQIKKEVPRRLDRARRGQARDPDFTSREELINKLKLKGFEDRLTETLATSIKQHLALGCALIHNPSIVFLDEPTAGVDPISRKEFWEIIKELSSRGVTSLVTTHYMDEAEECDRLALISGGKIIACDTPKNLKENAMKGILLEVECDNVMEGLEILNDTKEIDDVALYGIYLHVVVKEENIKILIKKSLEEKNIKVRRIEKIVPSLEDVFVSLVEGEGKRETICNKNS